MFSIVHSSVVRWCFVGYSDVLDYYLTCSRRMNSPFQQVTWPLSVTCLTRLIYIYSISHCRCSWDLKKMSRLHVRLAQGFLRTNHPRTAAQLFHINNYSLCILMVYLSDNAKIKALNSTDLLASAADPVSEGSVKHSHTPLQSGQKCYATVPQSWGMLGFIHTRNAHFHDIWMMWFSFGWFGSVAEITQGGSTDTQLHRGQLPSAGGAAELPGSE